jgi:D,D-heptose 1,7-bisphosphate phosphatase
MFRAVFLDRDGTITRDVPYCSRPEDLELLPGVGEGIRLLNENGFMVVIISNQSGIARNYFTEAMLQKIHQKMKDDLAKYGAHIDAIYYCPHHPDSGCECRKPKPTLAFRAAKEHHIDLSRSFFIGDKLQDIKAGHLAGCKTLLISTAKTSEILLEGEVEPDFTAPSFRQAVQLLLAT